MGANLAGQGFRYQAESRTAFSRRRLVILKPDSLPSEAVGLPFTPALRGPMHVPFVLSEVEHAELAVLSGS